MSPVTRRSVSIGAKTLIAFFVLLSPLPALADCCKCHPKAKPTDNLCLTDVSSACPEILTKNSSNKSLEGVTCDSAKLDEKTTCKAVSEGGSALCQIGPIAAVSYATSSGVAAGAGTSATGTAPTIKALPLKLNVDIPGLQFSENIVSRDGFIEIPYLAQYIAALYNYLLGIVVIAAAVMVVYGGFKYVLSSTMTGVKDGKETIKDAIIGLVVALGLITIMQSINPALVGGQALKIRVITPDPYLAGMAKDTAFDTNGVIDPANKTATGAPGGPAGGTAVSGKNKGCVGTPKYQVKPAACNSIEDCYNKFCSGTKINKNAETPSGYFTVTDVAQNKNGLKNFGDFPEKKEDQIEKYGLYMGSTKFERLGKALLTEAYDGLLKAGEAAKARGFYIAVGVTVRTWDNQIQALCERYNPVTKAASGLALPGASPHQIAIGIDASLFEIKRDAAEKLVFSKNFPPSDLKAGIAPLCVCKDPSSREKECPNSLNQVDAQILRGAKYLRTFEEIMAVGGYYHYCQEGWHFDYGGVYASLDCTQCAFPPDPPRGDFNCKINYLDKLKPE